ncbi:CHAT domain-containing protein [Nonomuraea sp. NPDC059007]|uniref:CHAT domain-containing protein n=1 Tax=Nonomuraea sp. NPDC059007 TaxID=3346692 RepID=UPI00368826EC
MPEDVESLVRRIRERVIHCRDTGRPDRVVGSDALAEAAALIRLTDGKGLFGRGAAGGRHKAAWSALAELFWLRFAARPEADESLTDLASAFAFMRRAPAATPYFIRVGMERHRAHIDRYAAGNAGDHSERLARADDVVKGRRAEPTRAEFQQAAEDYRYVLRYTPILSPGHVECLGNKVLAVMLGNEWDDPMISEVERDLRQILAIEAAGMPWRVAALSNLVTCLQFRWHWRVEDPAILRECASLGWELANSLPDDSRIRLENSFMTGRVIHGLCEKSGDTELSVVAVTLLREAARAADERNDTAMRRVIADVLSTALLQQYRVGDNLAALRDAREESILAIPPFGHTGRAEALVRRMIVCCELVARTKDVELMREAETMGRSALQTLGEDDPVRVRVHDNLAEALRGLFTATGDRQWLQQAVIEARDAEAASASAEPSEQAILLARLCDVLLVLYEEQGNSRDLGEAIEAGRRALQVCPPDVPARTSCLTILAKAMYLTGDRTSSREASEEAVALAEQALATCEVATERRTIALRLTAYLCRLGRSPGYARRAVDLAHQELAALPPESAERAPFLANLAAILGLVAQSQDDPASTHEALSVAREAVAAAPGNGSAHANLGLILRRLYERTPTKSLLDEASAAFTRAAKETGLPAMTRIQLYRNLGWAHMTAGETENAQRAFEQAITLLPHVSSVLIWRHDRQKALAETAGLAAEAASAAAAAGHPERAVELLEKARGTLLTETIDRRGLLAGLAVQNPGLADLFGRLLHKAELFERNPDELALLRFESEKDHPETQGPRTGGRKPNPGGDPGELWRSAFLGLDVLRQEYERAWGPIVGAVRGVSGFEDFMLPLSAEALRRQATDGPIVFINVSRYRGDALIITPKRIFSLHLPDVDEPAIIAQVNRLHDTRARLSSHSLPERRRAQQDMSAVLGWLWDHIAGPVLDALGFTGHDSSAPPRIWWCPIGVAAPLPLHAAGHHHDGRIPRRTVLDRAVSSYTPTVRALRYARATRTQKFWTGRPGALIVAVPELPGAEKDLPAALAEAYRVRDHIPDSLLLSNSAANHDAVSTALESHGIVHFACHGVSDWSRPDCSTLLLYDHADCPFRLTTVANKHLPGAALAYLSACDTTHALPQLHDEAIHITSAFQLAGYRHVIGTLWPIDDQAALEIADAFYTALTNGGTAPPDVEHAPAALHRAVRELRDKYPGSPALWAAHIHAGS